MEEYTSRQAASCDGWQGCAGCLAPIARPQVQDPWHMFPCEPRCLFICRALECLFSRVPAGTLPARRCYSTRPVPLPTHSFLFILSFSILLSSPSCL